VRNRPLTIGLVAVIVLLLGTIGFLLAQQSKEGAPAATTVGGPGGTADAVGGTAAVRAVNVAAVAAVEDAVGRSVRITGNVKPYRDVTLVSKVPGTVVWTAGSMGARVEEGEPVLRLDDTELRLQLAQAEAGYAAARANLARLDAGAAEEEIAQVESAVEQARLGLERAATMLERQERLFAQGIIPEETLQNVRTEHDMAQLQYESALQQLNLVRRGASKEERDALAAQVQQAEAAVQLARQQLNDAVVRAPFTGLLASQPAAIGTLIGAGTPVAGLVDIDQVIVEASVGEREINDLQVGDTVTVTVDALAGPAGDGRFDGVIDAVAPVADQQTGTFPVRFLVDNEGHGLKPGMVARIELEAGRRVSGPVVPEAAVVRRAAGSFVFVPVTGADGRQIARERPVTTGVSGGGNVLIQRGLSLGDVVLVPEAGATLRDGDVIQIVREEL